MHCEVRDDLVYITLVECGVTKAIAYSVAAYHQLGWAGLKTRCRLDVIKFHKQAAPLLCPVCGSAHALSLYNVSGKYLDDDDDYEWLCKSCGHLKYIYHKEPGTSRRLLRIKRKETLEPALPGHLYGRFA